MAPPKVNACAPLRVSAPVLSVTALLSAAAAVFCKVAEPVTFNAPVPSAVPLATCKVPALRLVPPV